MWLSSWRIVILPAVRDESGKPLLDGVVEAELSFTDQLENDRRGVGLRQARDLEVVARPHRRLARDVAESGGEPTVRFPSRTSRIAPGAPAATSASTSFCSPAAWCSWQSSAWPSPMRRSPRPPSAREHCSADRKPPAATSDARSLVFRSGHPASVRLAVEQSRARRCADRETPRSRAGTSRRSPSCRATWAPGHPRGEVVPSPRWPVGGPLVHDWLVRLVLHHARLHRWSSGRRA